MKTLVILFALALCFCNSQAVSDGYSQVPDSDIQNSTVIQTLAQSGADSIVQLALSAGNLANSDTNFKLTKINSVYQQAVDGAVNYRFDATLTNSDNGLVINAIYIVNYQLSTQAQVVTSSNYQIVPHAPIPATGNATASSPQADGYTLIPSDEVQNSSLIQYLAELGVQNIIQLASLRLPTPNPDLKISKINSVYQQAANGVNYKFNVTLTNSDDVVVMGNYVVNYQPATNTTLITSSSYLIAPHHLPVASPAIITNASADVAATTASTATPTAPNVTTTTTTTTYTLQPTTINSTSTQTAVCGYIPLSTNEVQNNPIIQYLADFGAQNITQQAIADGKAPVNSNFTVSNINSASALVVNGINYNFNVNLANADKSINLIADYIIYYQSWTNTRKLLAASYVFAPQ